MRTLFSTLYTHTPPTLTAPPKKGLLDKNNNNSSRRVPTTQPWHRNTPLNDIRPEAPLCQADRVSGDKCHQINHSLAWRKLHSEIKKRSGPSRMPTHTPLLQAGWTPAPNAKADRIVVVVVDVETARNSRAIIQVTNWIKPRVPKRIFSHTIYRA